MKGDNLDDYMMLYADGFPGDNASTAEHYFCYNFNIDTAYINADKTACLHVATKKLLVNGLLLEIPFIGAVSTLTKVRGMGKIGQIIERAIQDFAQSGAPFVGLYPLDNRYYRRYGFITACASPDQPCAAMTAERQVDIHAMSDSELLEFAQYMHDCYTQKAVEYSAYQQLTVADMLLRLRGLIADGDAKVFAFSATDNNDIIGYRVESDVTLRELVMAGGAWVGNSAGDTQWQNVSVDKLDCKERSAAAECCGGVAGDSGSHSRNIDIFAQSDLNIESSAQRTIICRDTDAIDDEDQHQSVIQLRACNTDACLQVIFDMGNAAYLPNSTKLHYHDRILGDRIITIGNTGGGEPAAEETGPDISPEDLIKIAFRSRPKSLLFLDKF